MQKIILNDGVAIPQVGFGTFQIPAGEETERAVAFALSCGCRHIDTAAAYFNEADVGKAVRASGVKREEVFVTSKLWLQDYGYEAAKKGIDATACTRKEPSMAPSSSPKRKHSAKESNNLKSCNEPTDHKIEEGTIM